MVRRGQLASQVVIVLTGTAHLRLEGLQSALLNHYGPGDMVGEFGFVQSFCNDKFSYTRMCDLFAAEDMSLAVLFVSKLKDLNADHPKLAWMLHRTICNLAFERMQTVRIEPSSRLFLYNS